MNVDLEACEEDQDTLKGKYDWKSEILRRKALDTYDWKWIQIRNLEKLSIKLISDFRLPSFEPEEPVSRRLTRSVDR